MTVRVTTFVNGRWKQNCYIASSENGDALVIDPGSEADELIASVKKLSSLPGELVVYGGHGQSTTIAAEFATGAKVRGFLQ